MQKLVRMVEVVIKKNCMSLPEKSLSRHGRNPLMVRDLGFHRTPILVCRAIGAFLKLHYLGQAHNTIAAGQRPEDQC